MSIQSKLKETVKQILTERCGREYERTYFHALKYSGYSNVIEAVEEKQIRHWKESALSLELPLLDVLEFDPEELADYASRIQGMEADWIVLKEAGGSLSGQALFVLKFFAAQNPDSVLLYGDEDVFPVCEARTNPWLKPDWSPSLFENMYYIGGLCCVRKSAVLSLEGKEENVREFVGRVLKTTGGFEKRKADGGFGMCSILHVPYVLSHHIDTSDYDRYMNYRMENTRVGETDTEITSVIIPSKDHPTVLKRCLESILKTVKNAPLEIVVVDNGSNGENRKEYQKLIHDLINANTPSVSARYCYQPMEFHFSEMCNIGASVSKGAFLLFLNDDTEAMDAGWLEKLKAEASKPYVGAVGAKLLYPDSDKIQHAGIVNLPMGPVHKLQFMSDSESYYFGRNHTTLNVLAVTGACLMVRREVFEEAGGFPKELPVAFNDVDLCFSIYEKGYYNVIKNEVSLFHHESLSRGDDESPEKIKRLEGERQKLYERHPRLLATDPYYHRFLNREGLDTRIVPAPEEWLLGGSETVWVKETTADEKAREHKGLYVRVESVGGNFVQGYSFMAGDDNACYEKRLLFTKEEDGKRYETVLGRKLRQDLQDNMPDQKHVALSGFAVNVCGLPAGNYRIGILARNKVTNVTYVNECARSLCIRE